VSVHCEDHRGNDLSGKNVLLSDHFYYFGDKPQTLPGNLIDIVKYGQEHRNTVQNRSKQENELFKKFVAWIEKFEKSELRGKPSTKLDLKEIINSRCGWLFYKDYMLT
jgi:hypothetical protein